MPRSRRRWTPAGVRRGWIPAATVVVTYGAAAVLNAGEIVFGAPPRAAGVAASALYLASWLVQAFRAGLRHEDWSMRHMTVFWAVAVGGTAISASFVHLNLGTGAAIPSGWVAPAILLVAAAPLYGLSWGGDPLSTLVAVAFVAAFLTLAAAAAGRARAGRTRADDGSAARLQAGRLQDGRPGAGPVSRA